MDVDRFSYRDAMLSPRLAPDLIGRPLNPLGQCRGRIARHLAMAGHHRRRGFKDLAQSRLAWARDARLIDLPHYERA
jgi:hypothetical protein